MTVVTTDQQLAKFAVEMAAGRTGWPSQIIPLEDGWLVRNAHVELGEAEVRQAFTRQQARP